MRWTVDEPEDLQVIRSVVTHFAGRSDFTWEQVLALSQQQPNLLLLMRNLPEMKARQWVKVRSYGGALRGLFLAEICFFPSVLRCFCPINGRRILPSKRLPRMGSRWP